MENKEIGLAIGLAAGVGLLVYGISSIRGKPPEEGVPPDEEPPEEEPEFEPGPGPCPASPVHVGGHWCMRCQSGYTVYYGARLTGVAEHYEYYRTSAPDGAVAQKIIDESQTFPDYIEMFLEQWPLDKPVRPGTEEFVCPYCSPWGSVWFSSYPILRLHVMGSHYPSIVYRVDYYSPDSPDYMERLEYQAATQKMKYIDAQYYKKLEEGTLEPCGGYYMCPECGEFSNTLAEYLAHGETHEG